MADKYIMNNSKTDHSSAFGLNPEGFDKKINENNRKRAEFKARLRSLLLEEPAKMDMRFHEAVSELRKIKEEFNIK